MFTGIVEETGTISKTQHTSSHLIMTIHAEKVLEDVQIGDSIAVNGVCLTVTSFTNTQFTVDVINESLKVTQFGALTQGSKVNLERALTPTSRLGGHFVTGHIDGCFKILKVSRQQSVMQIKIELPEKYSNNIIHKGSVAVNGISLTVFERGHDYFILNIIPETVRSTTLSSVKAGDAVHIEFDMLGKYVLNKENNHNEMSLERLEMIL